MGMYREGDLQDKFLEATFLGQITCGFLILAALARVPSEEVLITASHRGAGAPSLTTHGALSLQQWLQLPGTDMEMGEVAALM